MNNLVKNNFVRQKKILVIDDDPGILDSMKLLLKEFDYKVETSSNVKVAYGLKEELPDLILLDIWMSGTDGRDVCSYLKGKKETKHIPIIMVSANKDTESIAKKAGANGFINKPFDMYELLNKIAQLIA